jgi:two-component system alkaline phosphatase synthesis response regulator PhoP
VNDALDVLVVEDDAGIRDLLAMHLAAESWTVRTAADGALALEACRSRAPDVVVLDLSLPKKDGLEVCRDVHRELSPRPGIVMVTARGSEADVLLGFEMGADDYVLKPCRPREVVARVRAVAARLRHAPAVTAEPPIDRGPLRIELGSRRVLAAGVAIELTATEFDLLVELARAAGRVVTRRELLSRVWDTTHLGYARNVDCHVTRLRRRLEASGVDGTIVRSVRGVGYALGEP